MKRTYLIGAFSLLLVFGAIAQQPTLTDAQAQALMMKASQAPLTPAEAAALNQYITAKQRTAQATVPTAGVVAPSNLQPTAPAAPAPASTPAASASTPKKAGVVRIGIVMPKAQMGQGNQGPTVGEPLRQMLTMYLHGPSVEVVPISAMLPAQIDEEAKLSQCDYLVFSSITQVQQKKSGLGFLKSAATMGNMVPMMSMGAGSATGAMVASATAAQAAALAQEQATLAGTVKGKSEVTLEYKLQAPGNPTALLSNSLKAKADNDGQDVVTPLVEQEATQIMGQVTKK